MSILIANAIQLMDIAMSGILPRNPKLRLASVESGIGWIPFVLERLDFEHHNYGEHISDLPKTRPSEQFRRNVYCTFQDEKLGVRMIEQIGEDNVMWASDYPHGDSTWPHSRKSIGESPLSALGDEAVRKVTCENAARLYRL